MYPLLAIIGSCLVNHLHVTSYAGGQFIMVDLVAVQTSDKVNACCVCVCQKNAFTRIITTTNAYTRTVYASKCNAFFHTYVVVG